MLGSVKSNTSDNCFSEITGTDLVTIHEGTFHPSYVYNITLQVNSKDLASRTGRTVQQVGCSIRSIDEKKKKMRCTIFSSYDLDFLGLVLYSYNTCVMLF